MDLIYSDEIIEFGHPAWSNTIGEFAEVFSYLGKRVIKIKKHLEISHIKDAGGFYFKINSSINDVYIVSTHHECYLAGYDGKIYVVDWGLSVNLYIIEFEDYKLLIFTKR
jgi:hypothetical protein